jgi:hypothetical protein
VEKKRSLAYALDLLTKLNSNFSIKNFTVDLLCPVLLNVLNAYDLYLQRLLRLLRLLRHLYLNL